MKGSYEYSLFNRKGQRKYLNIIERQRFYESLNLLSKERRLFCQLLYWSGMRISEGLSMTLDHLDISEKAVIVRSLKKRGKVSFRQIPLPSHFFNEIVSLCSERQMIWGFSRSTASRFIKQAMNTANVTGAMACTRGLRHSFAVNAITHNVPLTLIQKWMGHASISTTSIYLNVIGAEERNFAKRMWGN